MKIQELIKTLHEDVNFDDDEEPDRQYPNPLPSVEPSGQVFDMADEIDDYIIQRYKQTNNIEGMLASNMIGKVLSQGRRSLGDVIDVPINQIVTTEAKLYKKHLETLMGGGDVKTSSEFPFLLKLGGKYFAADGNHRIVANHLQGKKVVNALVLDVAELVKRLKL